MTISIVRGLRGIAVVIGGSLLMMGCWNKEYNEPGEISVDEKPTSVMMAGGFQRSWAAVQTVMAKFPIEKKDSDGLSKAYLVTDWVRGKSDRLYHGFDVNRVPYVIRYKMQVYLDASSGKGTKVTIRNIEQYLDDIITAGVDVEGSVQTWVRTETSTLKEYSLLQQIDKLVRDPKFKGENLSP